MICPNCQKDNVVVIDSRDDGRVVWRRRKCLSCGYRFTTYERIEVPRLVVKKRDGRREPFSKEKIIIGITKACEKRPVTTADIHRVAEEIEQALYEKGETEIKSKTIGELVMEKLEKLDKVAYIRFASVYKDFKTINSFSKELKKLMNK